MNNPALPTDDEFLEYIYDHEKDEGYIASITDVYENALDPEELFVMATEAGVWSEDNARGFHDLTREVFSPEIFFRGQILNILKDAALQIVEGDRERLEHIPVGLLPTRELNACAIATPRGGAVILLDQGVIFQLAFLVRCATAFITWNSETPFCRDATQEAYGRALVALATVSLTGDVSHLVAHRDTLLFPSLGIFDDTTPKFCELMEVFILLHEYGHVIRGHLRGNQLRPAFSGQSRYLREYTKSEEDEFEADEYAIQSFLRFRDSLMQPGDVAWFAGLVLKFFELCELIGDPAPAGERTHPPAKERWERVKVLTRLDQAKGAFAKNLDPAFDVIFRMATEVI